MDTLPFDVRLELEGWRFFWAQLELREGDASRSQHDAALAAKAKEITARVRTEIQLETLASHPAVAALRKLFKAAGCDPTRYRPSSEALLRRLLKGEEIPPIHPLVDLNNCLSAALAVPCCVMAEDTFTPPVVFRAGRTGESYESLKGPFNLEGKPLLLDAAGPLDAPITGSQRVKVRSETRRALLVAYLPAGIVTPERANAALREILESAPVAQVLLTGTS